MSGATRVGCFTMEGKPEAGSDDEAGRGSVLLGQEDSPTVSEQEVCSKGPVMVTRVYKTVPGSF